MNRKKLKSTVDRTMPMVHQTRLPSMLGRPCTWLP